MSQVGFVAQQPQYNSKIARADFERFHREKELEAKKGTTGLTNAEKMELTYLKGVNIASRVLDKDMYTKY